ncbi:MAG: GNAT family N-acetyltransferase, partial [Treponema sp.]|nr:GNAT family N-acetyltransferase [Treponema sp.]
PYPKELIKSPFEQHVVSLLHRPLYSSDPASPWWSSYPAHLHIDILPAIQGQGVGKALMHILSEALDRRGCPGVHLGVSKANTRVRAFYCKRGVLDVRGTGTGPYAGEDPPRRTVKSYKKQGLFPKAE